MEKFHYRKPELDDAMSEAMFERYLESLDSTATSPRRTSLRSRGLIAPGFRRCLRTGRLDPAFEIFRRFRRLVEQSRESGALGLPRRAHSISNATRATPSIAANCLGSRWRVNSMTWRKRVKNDIPRSFGTAGGKPADEIDKTLRKRYESIARRVSQMGRKMSSEGLRQRLHVERRTTYQVTCRRACRRTSTSACVCRCRHRCGAAAVTSSPRSRARCRGPAERRSSELGGGDRIVGVAQGDEGE